MAQRGYELVRRWRPTTGLGVVGALFPGVFLAAAVAVDLLVPNWYCPFSPPLVVVVPALAAATAGIVGAAAYTGLSALVSVLMIQVQDNMMMPGGVELPADLHYGLLYGQLVALIVTFAVSLIPGHLRSRRERTVQHLRSVSEAAQQAILAPIPQRDGNLRASAQYVAAADEALIGGDLYDIVETPFGTRMIVGDVRGKGLAAVSSANNLLGAFRSIAPTTSTLPELAERLNDSVRRHNIRAGPDAEEFITATLVSIPPRRPEAEYVCLGHPPPMFIHDGRVIDPDAQSVPPFGIGHLAAPDCPVNTVTYDVGDRILLYTDGVTEARDNEGRFYPLPQRVQNWADTDPSALLQHLVRDLNDHVGGHLNDDAALLAAQRLTLATWPTVTSDDWQTAPAYG